MDRRVKERLIGASILVALVVLVVPELLSGPKPSTAPVPALPAGATDPIRHVNVDLATSKPTANAESQPAVAEPPTSPAVSAVANTPAPDSSAAAGPASSATSPTRSAPNAAPAGAARLGAAHPSTATAKTPATKVAAARSAAVESTAHSPISTLHGSWSVQLGSFASRANADALTRQLKGQGFPVFVLTGGTAAAVRYRVRVGPLSDRESAERMAARLKSLGHAGSLVAPTA